MEAYRFEHNELKINVQHLHVHKKAVLLDIEVNNRYLDVSGITDENGLPGIALSNGSLSTVIVFPAYKTYEVFSTSVHKYRVRVALIEQERE